MLSLFVSECVYSGISAGKERRTDLYEDILTLAGEGRSFMSSCVELQTLKSPKVYPLRTSYILQ